MNTKRKTITALLSGVAATGWIAPKINSLILPAHAMTTGMKATTVVPTTMAPTTKAPMPEETTTEEPMPEETTTEEPMPEETTTEEPMPEATTTEEPMPEATTTEEPMPEATTTEEPMPEATTTEAPRELTPGEKYYNSQVTFRDNRMALPMSRGNTMKRGSLLGHTDTFSGTIMAEGINPEMPDAVYTFELSVNTNSRGESVGFILFRDGNRVASYGTRVEADGTWDSFDMTFNATGFDGAYYGTGVYGRICAPGVFGTYEVS